MIHGEHTVETYIGSTAKETVSGVWTKGLYATLLQFDDGRTYDFFLFHTQHATVTSMRIE